VSDTDSHAVGARQFVRGGAWAEGDVVTRREVLSDGRCWASFPVVVVRDDPDLLVTYIAEGAPFTFPPGDWPTPDGRHPWADRACWTGHGVLMLHRPGDMYAVWVFWQGPTREFHGWYVNLQEPFRRFHGGYDTQDLELDIWLPCGGGWVLKDDELLDVRVREGRFTEDQARAFRREAARITAELDAGHRWWDESWSRWRPPVGVR
jgi:Protein of unknown function (DUF402)